MLQKRDAVPVKKPVPQKRARAKNLAVPRKKAAVLPRRAAARQRSNFVLTVLDDARRSISLLASSRISNSSLFRLNSPLN